MFFELKIKSFLSLVMALLILFSIPLTSYALASFEKTGAGDEVPNYVRADITGFDLHGQDLSKSSIAGAVARDANFSDVDLHGTVLTLSDLKGANLKGINLTDTLSDRVNFQKTDLRDAILVNMIASGSSFAGARIEGADFTFAILDSDDQKNLCKIAEGINPITGVGTRESLECAADSSGGYKPAMPGA
ncbi:pentapeptide repeat-containing protein [Prochlorococcus sp. MIT 1223]|uniref:pentapeptide repeat-containing protein n=1 Tax=Prochlorococcus sp. MIT 1223 TaxID=3096217 RepID=UPI002A75C142|nr:pentapeptide repeat-containing protein [Prochlorococcus sp. MIT 1223]